MFAVLSIEHFVMTTCATDCFCLFDELIQSLNGRLMQGVLSLK